MQRRCTRLSLHCLTDARLSLQARAVLEHDNTKKQVEETLGMVLDFVRPVRPGAVSSTLTTHATDPGTVPVSTKP